MTTESIAIRREPARRAASSRPRLGRRLGLHPGDALVVIDVQRDFLPGGSLAVPGGADVITPLNAYMAAFDSRRLPIFLTRDWHPENHCSFERHGGCWPAHCVQGTSGAQWADGLNVVAGARIISKGLDKAQDAYSGFSGTSLLALLRDLGIRRVFVGGLATDYCVRATVIDACSYGFDVVVLVDAIRGVNVQDGDATRALSEMVAQGASLFQSSHAPGAPRHAAMSGTDESSTSEYAFGKTLTVPFSDAVDRVTAGLQREGFGVLSDIDVAATLQKRLGTALLPYRILGACNPSLVHRALQADPAIGLLLPCNVVVRQEQDGVVHVQFRDLSVLASLTDNPALAQVAAEVRRKLVRVMNAL